MRDELLNLWKLRILKYITSTSEAALSWFVEKSAWCLKCKPKENVRLFLVLSAQALSRNQYETQQWIFNMHFYASFWKQELDVRTHKK